MRGCAYHVLDAKAFGSTLIRGANPTCHNLGADLLQVPRVKGQVFGFSVLST